MPVSHATIIGRTHRALQQNGHDSAHTGANMACAFGVVLDGCGGRHRSGGQIFATHNEVGAKLLGAFITDWLHTNLVAGPLEPQLVELYGACHAFYAGLLSLFPMRSEAYDSHFVATHLLCTIVGFVVAPTEACFFWSGDGYLCHDGAVHPLDCNNRPDYLAYRLLDPDVASSFQICSIARDDLRWLAVATDGWQPHLLHELERPLAPLALQRTLNVHARHPGCFDDDGAVALWWDDDNASHDGKTVQNGEMKGEDS